MRSILLALMLILTGCGGAVVSRDGNVWVAVSTDYDPGGDLIARMMHVAHLRATSERFVIPRTCLSACTLYLAVETACLQPGSVLGFHGPSSMGGVAMTPAEVDYWSAIMVAHYPPPVRDLFWAGRHSQTLIYVAGDDLIAAGILPTCNMELP